jgi:hypothetical protein
MGKKSGNLERSLEIRQDKEKLDNHLARFKRE